MTILYNDGDESDWTLAEEARSVWITVDNISVYIVRTDAGVSVDLFAKHRECDEPLAGTWALQQHAATEDEIAAGMSMPDGDMEGSAFGDHMREPM